ncbi:unnamed protein product [Calypogeia fissa]
MGSSVEDTGMSEVSDLETAKRVQGWRSRIQKSSSLIIKGPLEVADWRALMYVLEHEDDVSRIEHLKLLIPSLGLRIHTFEELYFSATESYPASSRVQGFGTALRKARFSGLKVLEIQVPRDEALVGLGMGAQSLGKLFREGQFTNLRELHITVYTFRPLPSKSAFDATHVLGALGEGRNSYQLTSLSLLCSRHQLNVAKAMNVLLKSKGFRNLLHLKIAGFVFKWTVLAETIDPLTNRSDHVDVATLLERFVNWCSPLEKLTINDCSLTSEQGCATVERMLKLGVGGGWGGRAGVGRVWVWTGLGRGR